MTLRAYPNSHLKSAKKEACLAGTFFLHSEQTQLNLSTTRARCHCILSVVRQSLLGHFCSLAMRPFFLSHSHRSPSRPVANNGSTVVSKKFGSLQTPGMMDCARIIHVFTFTTFIIAVVKSTPCTSLSVCNFYAGVINNRRS